MALEAAEYYGDGSTDIEGVIAVSYTHLDYCDACFTGDYPVAPPTRDIRGDFEA